MGIGCGQSVPGGESSWPGPASTLIMLVGQKHSQTSHIQWRMRHTQLETPARPLLELRLVRLLTLQSRTIIDFESAHWINMKQAEKLSLADYVAFKLVLIVSTIITMNKMTLVEPARGQKPTSSHIPSSKESIRHGQAPHPRPLCGVY